MLKGVEEKIESLAPGFVADEEKMDFLWGVMAFEQVSRYSVEIGEEEGNGSELAGKLRVGLAETHGFSHG